MIRTRDDPPDLLPGPYSFAWFLSIYSFRHSDPQGASASPLYDSLGDSDWRRSDCAVTSCGVVARSLRSRERYPKS